MAYRKAYRRTQREVDASKRLPKLTAQLKANTAALSATQREVDAARDSSLLEWGAALVVRDYDAMSYSDIRTLAMSYGIPGKQTREALIAAIEDHKR